MLIFDKDNEIMVKEKSDKYLYAALKNNTDAVENEIKDFLNIYFDYLISNGPFDINEFEYNNVIKQTILPIKSTDKINILNIINVLTDVFKFNKDNIECTNIIDEQSPMEIRYFKKITLNKPGIYSMRLAIISNIMTSDIYIGIKNNWVNDDTIEIGSFHSVINKFKCVHKKISNNINDPVNIFTCEDCGTQFTIE